MSLNCYPKYRLEPTEAVSAYTSRGFGEIGGFGIVASFFQKRTRPRGSQAVFGGLGGGSAIRDSLCISQTPLVSV